LERRKASLEHFGDIPDSHRASTEILSHPSLTWTPET